MALLGTPRLHLRLTDSTNARARALAASGAPHGTLVSAAEQTSGRGRQGRTWSAPPGRALLCSILIRDPSRLLSLAAGAAVAEACERFGAEAAIKWPNDILVGRRKVAGILVEGRPQEGWAVLGIGLNVAVRAQDFPVELQETAGSLALQPDAVEAVLAELLSRLEHHLAGTPDEILAAVRARDALRGRSVGWAGGNGIAAGIDGDGRLVVECPEGRVTLDAGEVHLDLGAGGPS